MEANEALSTVLERAMHIASDRKLEYVTPEVLLFALCEDTTFAEAVVSCGADTETLKEALAGYMNDYIDRIDVVVPEFSDSANYVIAYAAMSAKNSGRTKTDITHLLHGIYQLEESYAVYYMEAVGLSEVDLLGELLDGTHGRPHVCGERKGTVGNGSDAGLE